MKMTARTLWTMLAAVVVSAVAIVSVAAQQPERGQGQGFGPGRGRGFGPPAGQMLRGLDLTEAQRDQVREILVASRPDEATAKKTAELHKELHAALFADTPDLSKIEQLKAAIAEADAAAFDARIATQLKVAQVLTAEQRAKAREMPGHGPRGRGSRAMR